MSELAGLQMKYFILKPKGNDPYAEASRCAMYAYAQSIEKENPNLAADLWAWWDKERISARIAAAQEAGVKAGGTTVTVEERLRELESCIVVVNELHNLGDAIYDVRDRELEGWEGPKVKAYGEALNKLRELLKEGGVTL